MPDPLNMASSGKKGKKSKGKTYDLNTFLQEHPVKKTTTNTKNWADEVEEYDVVLPTAPKAARGVEDYSNSIPQNPPYNVYISNLPYDVEEDDIAEFFNNMKIISMRIPKDDRDPDKAKGFGYVEFEERENLIDALAKPVSTLKGRRIRIELATNTDGDRRRGGGRMDMNRDRPDRPEVSTGDWRSGGRREPEADKRVRFNRERGEGGGFGGRRDGDSDRPGAWRDATDRPSFRDAADRPSYRDNSDRDRFRRDDQPITRGDGPPITRGDGPPITRGEGPPRDRYERDRDGGERRGFAPRQMDRDDRNGGGGFGKRDEEPRMRPKLNLQPRTKPVENVEKDAEAVVEAKPAAAAPVPAASIFGNAKPVDTTARERQIEERLAKLNESESRKDDDMRKKDDFRGRRASPERRRYSPPRRSPEFRRDSPERRRHSPDRRRGSPERRGSPDRWRQSPRGSPDRRRQSPRGSPDRRRQSPRGSPDRRRPSPDRRHGSPDRRRRYSPPRRTDDKRGPPPRVDRPTNKPEVKDKKPPREVTEREMPKLKTPEPVNIETTNQYAFLLDDNENDSD